MFESSNTEHLPKSKNTLNVNDLILLDDIDLAVVQLHHSYNLTFHPYVQWMKTTAHKDEFRKSQLSFRYAVEAFSCALAACLSKIPQLEKRMHLAENIAEEHGHGDIKQSHKYTFLEYLYALGANEYEILKPIENGTYVFNQSLISFLNTNNYLAGSAALGVIEFLYIDISREIAHTIIIKEWVKENSQRHYAVHEKLDVQHANELFDISRDEWSDLSSREEIIKGMIFGAEVFSNLFKSMSPQ